MSDQYTTGYLGKCSIEGQNRDWSCFGFCTYTLRPFIKPLSINSCFQPHFLPPMPDCLYYKKYLKCQSRVTFHGATLCRDTYGLTLTATITEINQNILENFIFFENISERPRVEGFPGFRLGQRTWIVMFSVTPNPHFIFSAKQDDFPYTSTWFDGLSTWNKLARAYWRWPTQPSTNHT